MHANELLEEAQKRAVIVADQLLNNDGDPSLNPFDENNTFGGGTFETIIYGATGKTGWTNADKQFTLAITGVSGDVCEKLKENLSDDVIYFTPENCDPINLNNVKLTYNNDLSSENLADEEETSEKELCPAGEKSYCKQRDNQGHCTQMDCCSNEVSRGTGINGTDICCATGATGYCRTRDSEGNCTKTGCCSGTVTKGTGSNPDTCN